MNEKITLPGLTQLLALQSGDSKKQSEDFIKEFFSLISSSLAEGDQIKLKDLGVFKTISVEARKSVDVTTGEENEIPSHRKVVFVPSKELAAIVNEPFEMFETVEVDDDFDPDNEEESISNIDTQTTPEPVNSDQIVVLDPELVPELVGSADSEKETVENTEDSTVESEDLSNEPIYSEETLIEDINNFFSDAEDSSTEKDNSEHKEVEDSAFSDVFDNSNSPDNFDNSNNSDNSDNSNNSNNSDPSNFFADDSEESASRPRKFWPGFLVGFLSAAAIGGIIWLCFAFGIFTLPQSSVQASAASDTPAQITDTATTVAATEQEEIETDDREPVADSEERQVGEKSETMVSDQEDAVPTAPSDQKVYDTIGKTRYLTTMAKDHYGNYNLWPIIYEENKSFLGHPDRIRPGTKVVIPPLSKYGINPNNPDDVASIKRKGVEIYSRYK